MFGMLKVKSSLILITRTFMKRRFEWYEEGIKYTGFKYYPRQSGFKDPPYKPTKLFRVQRIKSTKGCPYWEKDIIKSLKLETKLSDIAIVKNTPTNNAILWRVKHLIKITPVTFPNGFPEDATGTYLKENGELIVAKKLLPLEQKLIASEKFEKDSNKLDGDTLRRESRIRWLSAWQT